MVKRNLQQQQQEQDGDEEQQERKKIKSSSSSSSSPSSSLSQEDILHFIVAQERKCENYEQLVQLCSSELVPAGMKFLLMAQYFDESKNEPYHIPDDKLEREEVKNLLSKLSIHSFYEQTAHLRGMKPEKFSNSWSEYVYLDFENRDGANYAVELFDRKLKMEFVSVEDDTMVMYDCNVTHKFDDPVTVEVHLRAVSCREIWSHGTEKNVKPNEKTYITFDQDEWDSTVYADRTQLQCIIVVTFNKSDGTTTSDQNN